MKAQALCDIDLGNVQPTDILLFATLKQIIFHYVSAFHLVFPIIKESATRACS